MNSRSILFSRRPSRLDLSILLAAASFFFAPGSKSFAQPIPNSQYGKNVTDVFAGSVGSKVVQSVTRMDEPSKFHQYYGMGGDSLRNPEQEIAQIFMKMDMNYDGRIDYTDPSDGGGFKSTPPGLMIATGEMSRCMIFVKPHRVDFHGDAVVTLEITGINRDAFSGEFKNFEQERASVGRIKVWKDHQRKELLLDSADPTRRFVEWIPKSHTYPYNLPSVVPTSVWIEGIDVSPKFLGDLRLLITVANRDPGTKREQFQESRNHLIKIFRTSFDHILFTVVKTPIIKEFINNNSEGAWWYPDKSGNLQLEADR